MTAVPAQKAHTHDRAGGSSGCGPKGCDLSRERNTAIDGERASLRPELTEAAQAKRTYTDYKTRIAAELAKFAEDQRTIEDRVDDVLLATGHDDTPEERLRIRNIIRAKELRHEPPVYGSAGIPPITTADDAMAQAFSEALARAGLEDTHKNRLAVAPEVWRKMQ